MTKDDIIKMARESGMELYGLGRDRTNFQFILQRFAALVAAAERDACAKLFDEEVWSYDYREIAAALRARGER